jgi:acyl CoA:acetate/3-ketoacid CoA transferase alpha subunit
MLSVPGSRLSAAGLLLKARRAKELKTVSAASLRHSFTCTHTSSAQGAGAKMSAAQQARLVAEMLAAGMGMPSEAADNMVDSAKRMGIDCENFGSQRSSKQIIEEHKQSLQDIA